MAGKSARVNVSLRTPERSCRRGPQISRRCMSSTLDMNEESTLGNKNTSGETDGRKATYKFPFDEQGDAPPSDAAEIVSFPAVDKNSPGFNTETKPVLLNAKEHAVGYLSRILNARVYEAAVETELQHAKNLSAVREISDRLLILMFRFDSLIMLTVNSFLFLFCLFCYFEWIVSQNTYDNNSLSFIEINIMI